jgi:hypothetical protein
MTTAGLDTYRSNTKKKNVLVSYVSFSCTEMEMEQNGPSHRPGAWQGTGTGRVSYCGLTLKVGAMGTGQCSKEAN